MSADSPAGREINVVAVCYQSPPDHVAAGLKRIAHRHGVILRGVMVCNRPGQSPARLEALGFDTLTGSNALLDFSGFFEGLERLLAARPEAAAGNVLFVNDTLFTKHAASCILGRLFGLDALLRHLKVPAIAGKLDRYRSVYLRNPWSGHDRYVSTFCFLLNAAALPQLRRLTQEAESAGALLDRPLDDETWGAGIPALLREHIRAHLVYEGSPYLWPSASRSNPELLRKKACCVYLENRLSGAIGGDGALVPINAGPRSQVAIFVRELLARVAREIKLRSR